MVEQLIEFVTNHWILVSVFLALLAALAVVESQRAGRKVGPQEAVMLLNRDEAVVVDIREKKEFSEGHIKNAIHIPMAKLKESDNQLRKHSDKLILLVDKAGQHSGMAVKELPKEHGLNVARLSGGMMEWRNANLPVTTK
ncbi:rhodanese-related sulfurtransferase [Halospina denitrificans]|uniref:Rhodanese-related sulfurtransferase n=1 Tax=Halospina denitrificans TaxID=332522 RepID=A0A4R7K1V5_9GAMM|nr:rhodanese-like domain-containing protein [Halospina denitrificans]TDT43489.1 rhodanese-related sulfurtransferase [Halospina denitrificans]